MASEPAPQRASALRIRFDETCAANGIVTDGQHFGTQQIMPIHEVPALTQAVVPFHQRVEDVYIHPDDMADVFANLDVAIVFGNVISAADNVGPLESNGRDLSVLNRVFVRRKKRVYSDQTESYDTSEADNSVRLLWGRQLKAALLKQLAGTAKLVDGFERDAGNRNLSGERTVLDDDPEDHMFIKETTSRPLHTAQSAEAETLQKCLYTNKRQLAPPYRQGALNIMLEQQPTSNATYSEFLGQIDLGFAWKRLAADNQLSRVLGHYMKEGKGGLTVGQSAVLGRADVADNTATVDKADCWFEVSAHDAGANLFTALGVLTQAIAVGEDFARVSVYHTSETYPRMGILPSSGLWNVAPETPQFALKDAFIETEGIGDRQMIVLCPESRAAYSNQRRAAHLSWTAFFRRLTSIEATGQLTGESLNSSTGARSSAPNPHYQTGVPVNAISSTNAAKYWLYPSKPTDISPYNDITSSSSSSAYFFARQAVFELPFDLRYTIQHNMDSMQTSDSNGDRVNSAQAPAPTELSESTTAVNAYVHVISRASDVVNNDAPNYDLQTQGLVTTANLGVTFPQTQLHDALRESTRLDPREVMLQYKYMSKANVGLNPTALSPDAGDDDDTVAASIDDNAIETINDPESGNLEPNRPTVQHYDGEGIGFAVNQVAATNVVRFMLDLKVTHTAIRAQYAYSKYSAKVYSDDHAPSIHNLPGLVEKVLAEGEDTAVVDWDHNSVTATDQNNDQIHSLVVSHDSGSVFDCGDTIVTYTATDFAGRVTTADFTVRVVDEEPPVITFDGNEYKGTDNDNLVIVHEGIGTSNHAQASYRKYAYAEWGLIHVDDNVMTEPLTLEMTGHLDDGIAEFQTTAVKNCAYFRGVANSEEYYDIVYTATDHTGSNITRLTIRVRVEDDTPPVLMKIPPTITHVLSSDALGAGNATVSWANLGIYAVDNLTADADLTITWTVKGTNDQPEDNNVTQEVSCPVNTSKTITFTVEDQQGNSTEQDMDVEVLDMTPPNFDLITQDDITVYTDQGENYATVSWTNIQARDNSNVVTVTMSHTSGSQFQIGSTIVTATAIDGAGRTSTYTFMVTVVDNEVPIFSNVPSNLDPTYTTDPGRNYCTLSIISPTPTDNSGNVTMTINHETKQLELRTELTSNVVTAGELRNIELQMGYNHHIWFTANDLSGNSTAYYVSPHGVLGVIVQDNEAPVWGGDPTVDEQVVDIVSATTTTGITWTIPNVTDNSGLAPTIRVASTGTTGFNPHASANTIEANASYTASFPVGRTTLEYTAKDASNNSSVLIRSFLVRDRFPPMMSTVPADLSLVTAHVVNGQAYTSPTTIVTPAYDDSNAANNDDQIPPTMSVQVTLPDGTQILTSQANGPAALGLPDLESLLSFMNFEVPLFFPLGTTILEWTMTDTAGNSKVHTQEIDVTDGLAPDISGLMTQSFELAGKTDKTRNIQVLTPSVTDDSAVQLRITNVAYLSDLGFQFVSNGPTGESDVVTPNASFVATVPRGTFDIVYEATDLSTNSNSDVVIQSITMHDKHGPMFVQNQNPDQPLADDTQLSTDLDVYQEIIDVLTNRVAALSSDNFELVDGEVITLEIRVTLDSALSTYTFDEPFDTILRAFDYGTDAETVVVANPNSRVFGIGSSLVTLSSTDDDDNTTSVTFTVVVIDNTDPVFHSFPDNQTVTATSSDGAVVTWNVPTFSDNSGGNVTLASSYTAPLTGPASDSAVETILQASVGTVVVTLPVGEHVVEYTLTDNSGNSKAHSLSITINDRSPPVVVTHDDPYMFIPTSASEVVLTAEMIDNGSHDAVVGGSVTLAVSLSADDNFGNAVNIERGDQTVYLRVTDEYDNHEVGSTTVTGVSNLFVTTAIDTIEHSIPVRSQNSTGWIELEADTVPFDLPATYSVLNVEIDVTADAPDKFPVGLTLVTCTATASNVADADDVTYTDTETVSFHVHVRNTEVFARWSKRFADGLFHMYSEVNNQVFEYMLALRDVEPTSGLVVKSTQQKGTIPHVNWYSQYGSIPKSSQWNASVTLEHATIDLKYEGQQIMRRIVDENNIAYSGSTFSNLTQDPGNANRQFMSAYKGSITFPVPLGGSAKFQVRIEASDTGILWLTQSDNTYNFASSNLRARLTHNAVQSPGMVPVGTDRGARTSQFTVTYDDRTRGFTAFGVHENMHPFYTWAPQQPFPDAQGVAYKNQTQPELVHSSSHAHAGRYVQAWGHGFRILWRSTDDSGVFTDWEPIPASAFSA